MESGFRRREIASDGVRISWLENDGDGPVVVALAGLAGTGDEFTARSSTWNRRRTAVLSRRLTPT